MATRNKKSFQARSCPGSFFSMGKEVGKGLNIGDTVTERVNKRWYIQ